MPSGPGALFGADVWIALAISAGVTAGHWRVGPGRMGGAGRASGGVIIIIIFHETYAAYRLWRGYIHFGIETLCCPNISPVSYQTFCRGPPLVLF